MLLPVIFQQGLVSFRVILYAGLILCDSILENFSIQVLPRNFRVHSVITTTLHSINCLL